MILLDKSYHSIESSLITRHLSLLILTIFLSYGSIYSQLVCTDFTITGTSTSLYLPSFSSSCKIPIPPTDTLLWTNSPANGFPMGFIKYTLNSPHTNVSIFFSAVNDDDKATVSVNGGGDVTLAIVNGCAIASGSVLGPYNGVGLYGDVQVNIRSTQPFTEVTIVNTSGTSGIVSGDCNSVIFNHNFCSVELGNDTVVCPGSSVFLDATDPDALQYEWQDGSSNATFTVTEPGVYWAEVTLDSCVARDSIVVDYVPDGTPDLGNDTSICNGQSMLINVFSPEIDSYLWNSGSVSSQFFVTDSGTYWLQTMVGFCTFSDTIHIGIGNYSEVNIGNDTTIWPGDTVILDAAIPNASYFWSDGSSDPILIATDLGIYWVKVTDNRCSTTDSINIGQSQRTQLALPNVFTPNGDGINDKLVPIEAKILNPTTTIIYDRWGRPIYETHDPLINWNGGDSPDGVYFCVIEYRNGTGAKKFAKWQVTLMR